MVGCQEIHRRFVHTRRVSRLVEHIGRLIPPHSTVLDVGCGDGLLADCLQGRHPDFDVTGLDLLVRPSTRVPVQPFDGRTLPFPDRSIDAVMMIDVLHHTEDPRILLREACRVARQTVVLKDHCLKGVFARPTLRFMDWVGNASYGVALPYNYWTEQQWADAFDEVRLTVDRWIAQLGLYPWPADCLFGRELHFMARLVPGDLP